jgi:UDP-N-acetylmuramoylalanine--D-glutamate ligase
MIAGAHENCLIMSELELAYHHYTGRILSVTGSDGKSTTCALLAHVLKHAGYDVALTGNIGTPFTSVVNGLDSDSLAVVEVSSYQLELTEVFTSRVAAILNLAPDHLARHGSMDAYAAAKARIFSLQDSNGWQVINADQPELRNLLPRDTDRCMTFSLEGPQRFGSWYENDELRYQTPSSDPVSIMPASEIRIIGRHNIANALAVIALTVPFEIEPSKLAGGLSTFPGLPHRLERIGSSNGILYINDSKATNSHAAMNGLICFDVPLVVLMGGKDKGLSFNELLPALKSRARAIIAFGESGPRIKRELGSEVTTQLSDDLDEALYRAVLIAQRGDIVILSPACSSFDQYGSFEERGDHFRSLVTSLPNFVTK